MSLKVSEDLEKDYAERESQWIELGKLGMGQALLDYYGVHPDKTSRMLQLVHKKEDDRSIEIKRPLAKILGIDNGLGVVLATLGRDSDIIDILQITMWEVRFHIGNRTTIFQPLKVREHDLFALLVNLASSPKIRNVTLYTQSQTLCSPANCIALEKAIASNTTLRELVIHHSSSSQQRKSLSTSFNHGNDSLYGQYHDKPLTVPALNRLVEGLRRNTTLETLEITTYPEDIEWVAKILVATATATLQEELSIIYVPTADHAAATASTGNEADLPTSSRINRSLKRFEFTAAEPPSESTWTHLLAPFVHDDEPGDDHERCSIVTRLFFSAFPSSGIGPLCSVLRTNKTLKVVGLRHCQFSTREWTEQIMVALQANQSVEHLDLAFSLGLTDDDVVFDALINLAQFSDSQLTSICVTGTGLENKAGAIKEELRGKNQNRALLKTHQASIEKELRGKNQNRALPKTHQASIVPTEGTSPKAGRIVLCGPPFAGKRSICKSLRQQHDSLAERPACETALQKESTRGRSGPGRQLLRKHANGRESTSDSQDGTRNLDILVLTGDHDPRDTTSMWDFAARQSKYHVLHDYCFPNAGNSCFLYVCSARHAPDRNGDRAVKNQQSIQEEFRYWMRFLASKFKDVKDQRGQMKARPHVTFVLTGKDALDTDGQQLSESRSFAKNTVIDFKEEFRNVLDISNTLEFIDAHSDDDVARLFSTAKDDLDVILKQSVLATEHEACWRVRDALQRWVSNPKNPPPQPILKLEQVEKLCVDESSLHGRLQNLCETEGPPVVPDKLLVESPFKKGLKIVLRYLSDAGDIIFVEKGLDLVVVSPRWLVAGVFGSLIDAVHGTKKRETGAAVGARNGSSLLGCLNPKTKSLREWRPDNDEANGCFPRSTLDEYFRRSLPKISFYQAIFHDSSLMIPLMLHLDLCFEEVPSRVGEELSKNPDPRFFVPVLLRDGGVDKPSEKVLKWTVHLPQAQRVCFVGRRLECKDKSLTFLSPGFFPRLQVILSNYYREQNWLDTEHFRLSQNLVRFAKDGMEAILEYSGNTDSFLDVLVRSTNDPEQTIEFIRNHVEKQIFEFCSSPKGCPGVTLVEAVIRPVCVEKLFSCQGRKEQAILVSTLDNYLRQRGKEYRHKWTHEIPGERDQDLAIELLQGGSMARLPQLDLGVGASRKRGKSGIEEFPLRIKLTTEDVHLAQKFEAKMNPTRKLPVMLHLLCDGTDSDDPHEISDQPGRVLHLPDGSKSCNIPVLRYVVNLLYEGSKVAAGFFNVQSVKQVDKFVDTLFRTPDMDIDNSILEGIVGQTGTQSDPSHVPSKEELVLMLEAYMQMNPSTEWLKQFLDVSSISAFQHDFKLRKVKHSDTKAVFWLCDDHFKAGLKNGTYKSAFH